MRRAKEAMEAGKPLLKISLNPDFTLKIELGIYEQQVLANRLKEFICQYNKMGDWLDDLSVPSELKEQYLPNFLNLHTSLNFLITFLKVSGVSDKDLAETLNIPF